MDSTFYKQAGYFNQQFALHNAICCSHSANPDCLHCYQPMLPMQLCARLVLHQVGFIHIACPVRYCLSLFLSCCWLSTHYDLAITGLASSCNGNQGTRSNCCKWTARPVPFCCGALLCMCCRYSVMDPAALLPASAVEHGIKTSI